MVLSEKVIHVLEPAEEITKLMCSKSAIIKILYDTCWKDHPNQCTTQKIMQWSECKDEMQVEIHTVLPSCKPVT